MNFHSSSHLHTHNTQNPDSHSHTHSHSHTSNDEHVEQPRSHLQQHPELRPLPDPQASSSAQRRRLQTLSAHDAPSGLSHSASLPVSPPSPARSEPELHGQDTAIYDPPVVARSYGRPVIVEGPYRRVPDVPPLPTYQPHQPRQPPPAWGDMQNPPMATDFRDELARVDGVITPGVDNTPFIQYAIEALNRNRDRDTGYSIDQSASGSSASEVILAPGHGPQYYPRSPTQRQSQHLQHPQRTSAPESTPLLSRPSATHPNDEADGPEATLPLPPVIPGPRESAHSLAETLKKGSRATQAHEWRPVETDELLTGSADVPPLTFRPWPLRAPALFALMALCLVVVGLLILSALYSHLHEGLMEWATIHGGRYFLFRFFPQLIAVFILLYAQHVMATMLRLLPFARLASSSQEKREGALFQEMYPTFLWPRLVGPWNVQVPILVTWLMNFTLPLQSSLFTVILVDQKWTWATVQGIAWTLVALYLALFASTVIIWRYWATVESTGVVWDPQSLADIAALVSETNTASDYRGTQLARSRDGIRFALRRRAADRLGYWTWKDGRHGLWHTLGSPMDDPHTLLLNPDPAGGQRMQRHDEKQQNHPLANQQFFRDHDNDHDNDHHGDDDLENPHSARSHQTYLPFALRTSPLLFTTIAGTILVTALFVVTYLPATRLAAGFPPSLRAAPQSGAFSPADFLFAFLPSLLGTILHLALRTVDLHLRILQPWAAMSSSTPQGGTNPNGAPAEASLLATYPTHTPFGDTPLSALHNHHWRLACVSLLSSLSALIPVLAGGSFMALTQTSTGEVRMFANMPAFGVLLGLLVLYVAAFAAVLPSRAAWRMPHSVTCLADVLGYLVNRELREEAALKRCVSRREMRGKMGVGRGLPGGMQSRWVFGFGEGGGSEDTEGELGVRRVGRFTERGAVRKSQIRRAFM
ncbi:hypothetical protein B0J18DRAFT_443222 [Chaetomium sp. MPI-SDFR-AT-0129]|nr:hypothetical protein B0J18DRAFT_443222 [Chaetomium sp. MPI-SDFR-AT-0129]